MAGLYLILGNCEIMRIKEAIKRLSYFTDEYSEIIVEQKFGLAYVSLNNRSYWAPGYDPETGIKIISTGRYPLTESEWTEAKSLDQFKGGIVNRYLIKGYLDRGHEFFKRPDGANVLIIYDPRESNIHIYTDHFGYYPIFKYVGNNELIFSSSTDALAQDHFVKTSFDEISFVEFLSAWRVTPPNTYYNEIKYAGAAKHFIYDIKSGSYTESTYWKPFENVLYNNFNDASEELEAALKTSIGNRTTSNLGTIINFTSGGMDSRAVLFCAKSPESIIGLNLYDEPNLESRIAKELCKAAGVKYLGFARDEEYYPRLMRQNVLVSNGMGSLEDHHYLGTRELITELKASSVMTSCSTDWFFKGYGLEKKYKTILGKNLPITELTNKRVNAFLPNLPEQVPTRYKQAVEERLENLFKDIPENFMNPEDWLRAEDLRARPACYAVSISGPGMYRMFPYDTFLGSKEIADCYGKIPPEWKLNSILWGKTIERIGGNKGKIIDANSGSYTGGP